MGLTTVEIGDSADIVAPTSDGQEVLFISPQGLFQAMDKNKNIKTFASTQPATETDPGILEIATKDEVSGGIDTNKAVTASSLPQAINTRKISVLNGAIINSGWVFDISIFHYQVPASQTGVFLSIPIPVGLWFDTLPTIISLQFVGGQVTTGSADLSVDLKNAIPDPSGFVVVDDIMVTQSISLDVNGVFDTTITLPTPFQTIAGQSYLITLGGTTGVAESINLADVRVNFGV